MSEGSVSEGLGVRGIPAAAEEQMVARDIAILRRTGGRLHIAHVSCAGSVEHIRAAKAEGLSVTAETAPISEWIDQARSSGLGDYATDALAKMFRYYDRHGLRGNPGVLGWLLARQPTTFSEFVSREMR